MTLYICVYNCDFNIVLYIYKYVVNMLYLSINVCMLKTVVFAEGLLVE